MKQPSFDRALPYAVVTRALVCLLASCASSSGATPPPSPGEPMLAGEGPAAIPAPTSPAEPVTAPPQAPPVAASEGPCQDLAAPGVLKRSAVARVVDAGMGKWLSGVEVERKLEAGRFRGWAVKRLYPGNACFAGLDLRAGDVVLTVNGRNVERPDAAHQVFNSLKSAPAIVVRYLRGPEERTLTVTIAD